MKLIFTLTLTLIYCSILGQSKYPTKQDVEKVINLTISQKITDKNPSCEYGQCGDWWTANKDSIFYKSDTLKFYNSSNIVYDDTTFCTSLIWNFGKENTFNYSEAQMCQEPPTRTININIRGILSGQKNEEIIPNRYKIVLQNSRTFIEIYTDQKVFEIYKVIELTKTTQANLGDKSYLLTLVRQKWGKR